MSYKTTIDLFNDDHEVEVFYTIYPGDPNPARFHSNGDIGDEPSSDEIEIESVFATIGGKYFDVSKHVTPEQMTALENEIYNSYNNARND